MTNEVKRVWVIMKGFSAASALYIHAIFATEGETDENSSLRVAHKVEDALTFTSREDAHQFMRDHGLQAWSATFVDEGSDYVY